MGYSSLAALFTRGLQSVCPLQLQRGSSTKCCSLDGLSLLYGLQGQRPKQADDECTHASWAPSSTRAALPPHWHGTPEASVKPNMTFQMPFWAPCKPLQCTYVRHGVPAPFYTFPYDLCCDSPRKDVRTTLKGTPQYSKPQEPLGQPQSQGFPTLVNSRCCFRLWRPLVACP